MTAAIKTMALDTRVLPTVAAGYARALVDFAVSRGAPHADLLARVGLTLDHLGDQAERLPLARYVATMKAGQDLCEDPALALHFGEAVNIATFSIVGLISRSSRTMLE